MRFNAVQKYLIELRNIILLLKLISMREFMKRISNLYNNDDSCKHNNINALYKNSVSEIVLPMFYHAIKKGCNLLNYNPFYLKVRSRAESNRCTWFCRPMPSHSATGPFSRCKDKYKYNYRTNSLSIKTKLRSERGIGRSFSILTNTFSTFE